MKELNPRVEVEALASDSDADLDNLIGSADLVCVTDKDNPKLVRTPSLLHVLSATVLNDFCLFGSSE